MTLSKPNDARFYMPSLDGLRGFACLLVIVCHVAQVFHLSYEPVASLIGGIGVFIFFSLSGFLMSMLYCEEKSTLRNIGNYAIARFSRIAPAYYIAVTTAWVLYMLIPDFKYEMTPLMTLRTFAFSGNQGIFWSIPPEVQFYGFFILLWLSYQSFKAGNKLWIGLMGLACLSFIMTRDLWGGLTIPSKLHIFLFGFLSAFLLKKEYLQKILSFIPFQLLITTAATLYAIFLLDAKMLYSDVIFAALVSLSVVSLSQSTRLTAILETNTMRMLGAVSFSVYLFHDLALHAIYSMGWLTEAPTMMIIAISSFASLAPTAAFYYLLEKRLDRWARNGLMKNWEKMLAGMQMHFPRRA